MNRGDYCISKAGIGMMARVFALRLAAHGAQVVEFRPGIMETEMTSAVKEKYDPIISGGKVPMRRWGQPSDVGRAVRSFLIGDLPSVHLGVTQEEELSRAETPTSEETAETLDEMLEVEPPTQPTTDTLAEEQIAISSPSTGGGELR